MKLRRLGLLLSVFALFWASGTSGRDPTSYPMVCRGGGSMTVYYDGLRRPPLVYVGFQKAPRAAGAASPGPGQCAWLDRPLNAGEPRSLVYAETVALQVIWAKAYGSTGNPPLAKVQFSDGRTKDLVHALDGDLFYVHAYNDRNERLVVTRFGP